MPKRSSKKKKGDVQKNVKQTANESADELTSTDNAPSVDGKNPAAVALGRLGGKKGGLARAKKLTAAQRREIAKRAAEARWRKKRT